MLGRTRTEGAAKALLLTGGEAAAFDKAMEYGYERPPARYCEEAV